MLHFLLTQLLIILTFIAAFNLKKKKLLNEDVLNKQQ